MRLIAIDPGDLESGWVLVETKTATSTDLALLDFGKDLNTELVDKLKELFWRRVDVVVIERIASYGMAVGKNVFETAEWVGRFTQLACDFAHIENVDYVYRQEEKLRICHDSRAKDSNIAHALIDRYARHDRERGKGTKKDPDYFYGFKKDCWAAFAVAVTYLDRREEERQKAARQATEGETE